jgi:hypothetical protein
MRAPKELHGNIEAAAGGLMDLSERCMWRLYLYFWSYVAPSTLSLTKNQVELELVHRPDPESNWDLYRVLLGGENTTLLVCYHYTIRPY